MSWRYIRARPETESPVTKGDAVLRRNRFRLALFNRKSVCGRVLPLRRRYPAIPLDHAAV
jgi:hypothetical protein